MREIVPFLLVLIAGLGAPIPGRGAGLVEMRRSTLTTCPLRPVRLFLRGGAAPPRIGVLGSPPPDDFEVCKHGAFGVHTYLQSDAAAISHQGAEALIAAPMKFLCVLHVPESKGLNALHIIIYFLL